MRSGRSNLEEFLGAILRGAAKILGCTSTNLLLFNERIGEIRVQIGAMAVSYPLLQQVERVLGDMSTFSLPISYAKDSLVHRAWQNQAIYETSSVNELAGSAFPRAAVQQVEQMIGQHRFICVPALSGTRKYGVLLFTKDGRHPYSKQQREVLWRYARRIGEILEHDIMGQGRQLMAHASPTGPDYLMLGPDGAVHGQSALRRPLEGEQLSQLQLQATRLAESKGAGPLTVSLSGDLAVQLVPLTVDDAPRMLCVVERPERPANASIESQLLQLSLGDSAPTLFLDTEFNITSVNDATKQVLGYSAEELLQQPIARLFSQPDEILAILSQQILNPDDPYCAEAAVAVHRDGSLAPCRVEVLVLADDHRRGVGFLVLIRDAAEPAQDDATRLLVHERLASMGEMATQLAHELRNPLVAIGATLEGLTHEECIQGEPRQILHTLAQEITRLDMLLRDYLAARHDISFTEVPLAELLADTSRLLKGARTAAGRHIELEVPPDLHVVADYDALKHALFNLLLNALEASDQGGRVRCRVVALERELAIEIADRGSGLTAAPADCLQPFFTTKPSGTGLGLAVCAKIARAHGGLVELRQREGGGCCATIKLPRRGSGWGKSTEAPRAAP